MEIAIVDLCIQMIKASYLCLVIFVFPNIKCQKEGEEFFDEECVKFFISKMVGTNIWPGICYLLNLLNVFQNPARKSASC